MPAHRIIQLTEQDSDRLKKWLELFEEPPIGINRPRFFTMKLGTRWISTKELIALNELSPCGFATDIIRGGVEISEVGG